MQYELSGNGTVSESLIVGRSKFSAYISVSIFRKIILIHFIRKCGNHLHVLCYVQDPYSFYIKLQGKYTFQ
jgi:hypothetical protein